MTWVITCLALLGTVLNVWRSGLCFAIWTVTNGYWAVYDWYIGATAQSVLFGIYFGLAVYGWFAWRKDKRGWRKAVRYALTENPVEESNKRYSL